MNWPNMDASIGYHFNFFDSNSHLFSRPRDDSISSVRLFEEENDGANIGENTIGFGLVNGRLSDNATYRGLQLSDRTERRPDEGQESREWNGDLSLGKFRKGLKDLAKLLLHLIKTNQPFSQSEIVKFIETHLCSKEPTQENNKNQKNIKRRIYDALNVMISADLLERESNNISIKARPTVEMYVESYEREIKELRLRVERKRQLLLQSKIHKKALNFWLRRNQHSKMKRCQKSLLFPLIFVIKNCEEIWMSCSDQLVLMKNSGLKFFSQTDIIEQMYQADQSRRHVVDDVTLQLHNHI